MFYSRFSVYLYRSKATAYHMIPIKRTKLLEHTTSGRALTSLKYLEADYPLPIRLNYRVGVCVISGKCSCPNNVFPLFFGTNGPLVLIDDSPTCRPKEESHTYL